MKRKNNIQIIGGGISGLSLALGLKKQGIHYEIYEQNSAITYENVGLGISANIFPILKEWQLFNETKKIGAEIKNFHFVDKDLKIIKSFVMQKPPLSVNRRLFYKLITDHLGTENIHLNSEKTASDFSKDTIVIAADGIHSQHRKKIHPSLHLRDSDQILWRGITEIELDEKYKNSYYDFIGNNLRFAIIHTGQNYYSWYVVREKTKNKETLDKETLTSYFKDYHPIVREVIQKSKDVYISEMFDINPKDRKEFNWFSENHLMTGDAIHATTPNMANGACLAIESSYLLAHLLSDESKSLDTVFKEFQKQRTQKVNPIVNQSWLLGKMLHQKNKLLDLFIKIGIKTTPKFLFDKIYAKVLVEVTPAINKMKS